VGEPTGKPSVNQLREHLPSLLAIIQDKAVFQGLFPGIKQYKVTGAFADVHAQKPCLLHKYHRCVWLLLSGKRNQASFILIKYTASSARLYHELNLIEKKLWDGIFYQGMFLLLLSS
jgi:hypothetical protein